MNCRPFTITSLISLLVVVCMIIPCANSMTSSLITSTNEVTVDDLSIPFVVSGKEIVPDGNGGYRIQDSDTDINIVPGDKNEHTINVTLRNNSDFYIKINSNIKNSSSGVKVNIGTYSITPKVGDYYYYPGAYNQDNKKPDYSSTSPPSTKNDCFYVSGGETFTITGIINPNSSPDAILTLCIYFFEETGDGSNNNMIQS